MGGAPHPEDENPVIKDFDKRVERYVDVRKKAEADAPPIDTKKEEDPAAIVAREQVIAAGIRAARRNAAEGDIFTPAVRKHLAAVLKPALAPKKGPDAREVVLGEGNPKSPESKARVDLVVNAQYPSKAPLSTMPPSVLLRLPKLPKGLEYRFVGKHLILYDMKANLIVDIFRNAVR
jgi:hypothetical protein